MRTIYHCNIDKMNEALLDEAKSNMACLFKKKDSFYTKGDTDVGEDPAVI